MAKVTYIEPVDHVSGKLSKKSNVVHHYRNYGARGDVRYIARITNPYDGGNSAAQVANREKFVAAQQKARALMKDPSKADFIAAKASFDSQKKYKTLMGFLVAKYFKED